MQRIVAIVLLACCLCNAAFFDVEFKDSRIQKENVIYKPGGILGFAAEFGAFNEMDNMVDYTLAVGISRFGYSHSDGDEIVSAWDIYIKPLIWSITVKRIMLEISFGFGYILSTNNFDPELEEDMNEGPIYENANVKYGYRLGYRVTDQIQISLVANYQNIVCGWHPRPIAPPGPIFTGGWGLNFQWNIPWIPF